MRLWTKTFLKTSKEAPNDAELVSHQLLSRAGFIKKLAPGIYSYGTLALQTLEKIKNVIREELADGDYQEILMPMIHPADLWHETGRWENMGEGLLKFQNRNKQNFCLGATHEEVVTDYLRNEIKSYKDLPVNVFQIQTKYRDEIRPRFGLLRGREFLMKDAYSFDRDEKGALVSYEKMRNLYKRIFDRFELDYRVVSADVGDMGGTLSEEFQALAAVGEDELLVCSQCDYAANREVAEAFEEKSVPFFEAPMAEFETPNVKTIKDLAFFLDVESDSLVKSLFVQRVDDTKNAYCVLLRGCDELNQVKVNTALGGEVCLMSDDEVRSTTGVPPGSCGPVGLNIPVIMDQRVRGLSHFVVGANREGWHLKNVVPGRDFTKFKVFDLRLVSEGEPCPRCGGALNFRRGIELGHIFYLGQRYAEQMGLRFLSETGEFQFVEMGCYGIGVSRLLQAVVEQNHDSNGIIWPKSLAPFSFHIVVLDQELLEEAIALARRLETHFFGVEVFIDDRVSVRPGVKFKDADLLGMPICVRMGGRNFRDGFIEVKARKSAEITKVSISELGIDLKVFEDTLFALEFI